MLVLGWGSLSDTGPPAGGATCYPATPLGAGRQPYRREQILEALVASCTGFRATREESCRLAGPQAAVVVHTGYWGCGAFGGNRQLMALLQALAASLAGLDRLVFHTRNAAGVATLESGLTLLARITARRPQPTAEVIEAILQQRFQWGVSDGN